MSRRGARDRDRDRFIRFRVYLVLALFCVLFAAVLARAVHLQVIDAPRLRKMASNQHNTTLTLQSRRGDIYDRNGKELAVSIEVDSIYAQPNKIDSPRNVARKLAPLLSMSRSEVEKKLKNGRKFVWVKRLVDLSDEDRAAVDGIDGVGIIKESRRYYPNRQLAANLMGFTGLDSNGLEGIELYYDNVLKGATRKVTGSRDARGRLMLFEAPDKDVPLEGMVVELTIDKTIQFIAEKALKKAIDESNAKAGTAIVMDPFTGEILATASLPTFDPNRYLDYGPSYWRNRVVTDVFEPGSTFKLFLISAALEEKVVASKDIFYCENGSYTVADRTFHDTKKHGWLSVPQIIKYSSNIGSAKIGEKLGGERLYRYASSFGFGEKTGVDLPGEASGFLRHYSKWSAVTVDTVSFGQGVSSTGLQLVNALSAIANGGFLMKPYVVKSVKAPDGTIISESHPAVTRRVVSEETAARITDMLVGVTGEDGTGHKASMKEFEVAGKTATAQKPDFRRGGYLKGAYVSSFFGFVPARSPRLAILVTVDEPEGRYYGGDIAAPVFKEIAYQSLSYLGVLPGRQRGPELKLVKGDALVASAIKKLKAADSITSARVPDFSGMSLRTVLRMAEAKGLEVELVGSGRAVSQKPAPGAALPSRQAVVVRFE